MALNFLNRFNTSPNKWWQSISSDGILINSSNGETLLNSILIPGYISQLISDGIANETEDGIRISWDSFFSVINSEDYADLINVLKLPPFTASRPILQSRNSVTDNDFSILLAGWQDNNHNVIKIDLSGPVITNLANKELIRPEQWNLIKEVIAFSRRSDDERNDNYHRQTWGKIRALAIKANAVLDDFLHNTVILTPEKLNIELAKNVIADDNVVEIIPSFNEAPNNWIDRFDTFRSVQDRYDLTTTDGIVQVLITPSVKSVLQEIKKLPLRRVAGSRAQAFTVNPYATLGEDAKDVIDEFQFEQAKEIAGIKFERFTPLIERSENGYPVQVSLLIDSTHYDDSNESTKIELNDTELSSFINKLENAISKNYQLLGWRGYDLEILGEAPQYLDDLKQALEQRQQEQVLVTYEQVYDLSSYSSRVEGIGYEKPYYSPYISTKNNTEWIPKNIQFIIAPSSATNDEAVIGVPTTDESIEEIRNTIEKAIHEGKTHISINGLNQSIPIKEAQELVDTITNAKEDLKRGVIPIGPNAKSQDISNKQTKKLILRPNIESVDYEEKRHRALTEFSYSPEIPEHLNPNHPLLPHQEEGLAWLQHLYKSKTAYEVRGAILADDMGLGKTYQLIALMAWMVENSPNISPMLVVAPVSLLENWAEEINKFTKNNVLPVLTAYGSEISKLRVPKREIDKRLKAEDGLINFLKPGWIGAAKVVLTTYETLRDLEFSFAAEHWSLMVCDEAQKIKNPSAMVTRSAKKQNVDFKIACTGTPVENNLADLWCLFDFAQPGLLGALNDFGKRYRKPIEARDDTELARIEELRELIAPQILRRTKSEVAKDLPKKIVVDDCRQLQISSEQRKLYVSAINSFNSRNESDFSAPFKNILNLLHYLKLICTDPRQYGVTNHSIEPIKKYIQKSPKTHWLLNHLKYIQNQNEKVIIFCEFRDIQRLLKHYIEEQFNINISIINGETNTLVGNNKSRQNLIKKFQEKTGFGVIILSPIAVGFGVNIQAANHVIHYTRTWNPAKEDQATDRAYRIGQEKDVFVYYPVITANDFATFDVRLDELLEKKRALANDILNGSGDIKTEDFILDGVSSSN